MPSFARFIGLSVLLLLFFLGAALVAQRWLERQHDLLRAEAILARRSQFLAAAELTAATDPSWSPARLQAIGRLIDARVTLKDAVQTEANPTSGELAFTQDLPESPGNPPAVEIRFELPATIRLSLLHGRTWVLLLLVAVTLILIFLTAGLLITRRSASGDTHEPLSAAKAEMSSLERLARTSVAQGTALASQRHSLQRAETDLSLNQRLLTQALEEKIRLGRDLHDGVIQSLYAVGLTVEAARAQVRRDPDAAETRLQQSLDGLNRTIREVRNYITGLAPDKLRRMSFAAAVEQMLQDLDGARATGLELVVDEDAAAALSPEQTTEALQIIREATSNSLRHGAATSLTIRLHRNDAEIGLLVRDDGRGFQPEAVPGPGHGLDNMRARAALAGATLRIDSRPGDGTRVVLTFPVKGTG
ncbi:MAG: sensor histidine kinase [Opitutales bacterium]